MGFCDRGLSLLAQRAQGGPACHCRGLVNSSISTNTDHLQISIGPKRPPIRSHTQRTEAHLYSPDSACRVSVVSTGCARRAWRVRDGCVTCHFPSIVEEKDGRGGWRSIDQSPHQAGKVPSLSGRSCVSSPLIDENEKSRQGIRRSVPRKRRDEGTYKHTTALFFNLVAPSLESKREIDQKQQ